MDKLKMHSQDKVKEHIAQIAALFPNALTETIKDGKVDQAIDFDILKQELSDAVVDGPAERYQFTWPDKKKSILLANAPIAKTLRPCREESVNFDTTKNLYLEGDNLDALKLLQETYLGNVKLIYIDPPYNTGNNYIYEDNYLQNTEEYLSNSGQYDDEGGRLVVNLDSNGRFHTDWLNMIYPRLKLAKSLLRDDGAIFISINDSEVYNLVKICNEIFGSENYIALFPWQSRLSIQNDTDISNNHEYVLAYARRRRQENRRLKENNSDTWYKENSFACLPIPLDKDNFDNPDGDVRGLWKADPFDAPNIRPNLTYAIINPNTGEKYWPPKGRCWRTEEVSYKKLLADQRIIFGKTGQSRPQLKVFYEEKKMFGSIDNTWWDGEKCGTTTQATKELIQLFGDFSPFDTPKPLKLLHQILKLVSRQNENEIILDFFSGSSTTAHAVMQMNSEDGGNRSFIMIQFPEEVNPQTETFKSGYKNICEIGKERIRRAGNKIKGETGLLSEKLDTGFRVLKVDDTNLEDVYYTPGSYQQNLLNSLAENIKPDRNAEDLLFQVMLDLGVLLSSSIQEILVGGKKVYSVADGYLLACFDKNVNSETVTEIAKRKPYYAIFRDSSMSDDSVATNFDQIFSTYSPTTVRKVI